LLIWAFEGLCGKRRRGFSACNFLKSHSNVQEKNFIRNAFEVTRTLLNSQERKRTHKDCKESPGFTIWTLEDAHEPKPQGHDATCDVMSCDVIRRSTNFSFAASPTEATSPHAPAAASNRTHERNETISWLDSHPQPPIHKTADFFWIDRVSFLNRQPCGSRV
jgi:hypothetical protein